MFSRKFDTVTGLSFPNNLTKNNEIDKYEMINRLFNLNFIDKKNNIKFKFSKIFWPIRKNFSNQESKKTNSKN